MKKIAEKFTLEIKMAQFKHHMVEAHYHVIIVKCTAHFISFFTKHQVPTEVTVHHSDANY
jgi:hypothetical protein